MKLNPNRRNGNTDENSQDLDTLFNSQELPDRDRWSTEHDIYDEVSHTTSETISRPTPMTNRRLKYS